MLSNQSNAITSPVAIGAAKEDAKAKRAKRMNRGYTHLQGDERVTAAFSKVFKMMEVKEQREEKI